MPEGPELGMELEGEDNQPETIGMDEILYASQSTLENAEDGTILREEYHLKLVTESGFQYQVGCLGDAIVTSDDTAILMESLRETFEAVEIGRINENGYFFELMTPYFYYTSGSYHTPEQVQTTVLALSNTSSSKSEINSVLENNVYTLLASNASYNHKVLPFLDFGQAPTYPQKGIRENDNNFQRNARRGTKQYKKKSRHIVGNVNEFQRNAPRQTKQFKMNSFHLFGKRSVGGNLSYVLMIQLSVVFCVQVLLVGALPVSTSSDSPLTLTVGSDGIIPFECRNEQQSAPKYYTVKFEEKDRPFYKDGAFDKEGLMSPDQAERFRVEYFEDDSAMSVEINIVSVSVEDQGTYIVLLIIQGVKIEYHLIKRVVVIFIPPGPATCFITPSKSDVRKFMVHCHSKPGNGNSTLTCFQNGDKIPYYGIDTQIVYRRIFWFMQTDVPVSCCSHDIKEINTITQTSCDQYRYPLIEPANSPVSQGNKIPTELVPTTKPLSVEEEKKQPAPESTSYSGCGRNVDWPAVMLPLIAFFTYMCISNP